MGQAKDHGVAYDAFTATAATPAIGFQDPTSEHGDTGLETLAGHLEAKLVETAEGGQISAVEPSIRARRDGSVGHVEVFQMSV